MLVKKLIFVFGSSLFGFAGFVSTNVSAEYYLATQCVTISGDVQYALNGLIANMSEEEWATVQCPVDVEDFYMSPNINFQDNNTLPGKDVSCYLRGRTASKEFFPGSSIITSARVSTSDVDADGYSGPDEVDEMTLPEVYMSIKKGAAVIECDLPPASSANSNGRSKIYLYDNNGR